MTLAAKTQLNITRKREQLKQHEERIINLYGGAQLDTNWSTYNSLFHVKRATIQLYGTTTNTHMHFMFLCRPILFALNTWRLLVNAKLSQAKQSSGWKQAEKKFMNKNELT